MAGLTGFFESVTVEMLTGLDIVDITDRLDRVVAASGIREGALTANIVGSTGSLTTIEFEPGVVADVKRAITEMAPPDRDYAHERAWHDGNGHSHVQAALLGPAIALAVRDGRLKLGTWQQVVAINHDNRPRTRTIAVSVVGVA